MSSSLQNTQPGTFKDRTVIVTGGAGTIGRALCLVFAATGASVVVNDLGGRPEGGGSSAEPTDIVVKEIKSQGGSAVADRNSVIDGQKVVQTAIDAFG